MGRKAMATRNALALAAVVVAAPACAHMGGVLGGMGLPGTHADVVDGEVRSVNVHQGRLSLRGWDGRDRRLNVHRDTEVRYDRRSYPVSALERGDEVRVYVSFDRRGDAWADRVEVLRSVRDHRGARPRLERRVERRVENLNGFVRRMDPRAGWFSVGPGRRGQGWEVVVWLPRRLERRDAVFFDRLRPGDRVRARVVKLGREEAELVSFR